MSLLYFASSSGVEQLHLDGITYPNNPGYQTDLTLMPGGLGNYQYSPLLWTALDKTFISVTDNSTPNKYYIYIYDHFRNKISDAIDIGLSAETLNDVHHIASIISTALNELLITETSPHGPAGNWKHSKTPTNYDVLNFPAWTDSGVNEYTYHQLQKNSNGDIFDIGRKASIAGNTGNVDLYKSTDDGVSFSLVHRVLDWGSQPDTNRYIPYPMLIYSNDDVLHLIVNSLDYTYNGGTVFIGGPITYHALSDDFGVTWRNINNTFSKDVVATSELNRTEMNTNMIAYDLGTATDIIRAQGGQLIAGNPYFTGGSGDVANSPLALYYWSGSAWVQKVITCAGHVIAPGYGTGANDYPAFNNSTGIFQNGSDIDLICTEIVSTKAQISRFRTSDLGTTWTFVEQITTGSYDHADAHINHNIRDSSYKVAACIDETNGNLFVKSIT